RSAGAADCRRAKTTVRPTASPCRSRRGRARVPRPPPIRWKRPAPVAETARRRAAWSPPRPAASPPGPPSIGKTVPASRHLLHEHLCFAAAGQPDLPRAFVGDAEIEQLRQPGFDRLTGG